MTEQSSDIFSERILRATGHENCVESVERTDSFTKYVDKIAEMLSLSEPIAFREDEDGSQYWYYLGAHEKKNIDVVITLKEPEDSPAQWFFGFLPTKELVQEEQLNPERIMQIADETATLMQPSHIIYRIRDALKYSRKKDLQTLKDMEHSKPEEGQIVTVQRAS